MSLVVVVGCRLFKGSFACQSQLPGDVEVQLHKGFLTEPGNTLRYWCCRSFGRAWPTSEAIRMTEALQLRFSSLKKTCEISPQRVIAGV